MNVTGIQIVIGALGTVTKGLLQGLGMRGDHPIDIIIEIDQNTEKSPADLKRLVVTQTQEENHHR